MENLRILLVEDDAVQAETIMEALLKELPGSRVDRISTEYGFRSELDGIAADPPDVVVMDVMLRWTDPRPDMPKPPPEIVDKGFYEAGLRCQRLLDTRESTKKVPVILYTVLDREDIESVEHPRAGVEHLSKESETWSLIRKIRELTQDPAG